MVERAGWGELFYWSLRRRLRYRVSGRSMLPLLAPDDYVLVNPYARIEVGDIVVARHPLRRDIHLVKRISRMDESGRAHLEGINPTESTDSRTLGDLPMALIVGRVTSRF